MAKQAQEPEEEKEIERPENIRPDSVPSYDINSEYQNAYLRSEYESDEYHELKNMEEDLNDVVTKQILKLDKFASLRPMDPKDLTEGMEVKVHNEKKAKVVSKAKDGMFKVRYNDGKEIEVKITSLEPAVDPASKLKKDQARDLYELCYEAMLKKTKRDVDIVYFFDVFTDYFRITPKYLFACLGPKKQAFLVEEITKRTGIKVKDGIKPIFMSK